MLDVCKIASSNGDAHLEEFIEDEFITPRVARIKKLGDYMTHIKRVGSGLGEFLFDQSLDD